MEKPRQKGRASVYSCRTRAWSRISTRDNRDRKDMPSSVLCSLPGSVTAPRTLRTVMSPMVTDPRSTGNLRDAVGGAHFMGEVGSAPQTHAGAAGVVVGESDQRGAGVDQHVDALSRLFPLRSGSGRCRRQRSSDPHSPGSVRMLFRCRRQAPSPALPGLTVWSMAMAAIFATSSRCLMP